MNETRGIHDPGSPWTEFREFVRAWARSPMRTGAIAPSSPTLAREMAFAAAPTIGQKVLELGPGTGTVTNALLEYGVPESDLVLIELSPEFAELLRHQYPGATVVEQDAFDALQSYRKGSDPVSAIVSSLPLLLFAHDKRRELIRTGLDCVQPMGRFVQFTYHLFSPLPGQPDLRAMRSRRVWGNLPPATVWTFQNESSVATA